MNKLLLPITILLGSVIIGLFYYQTEIKKQEFLLEQAKMKAEEEVRLNEQKRQELADEQNKQLEIKKQEMLNAEQNRASKAEKCVAKAEQTAVANFYIECVNNPNIGGSDSKCNVLDSEQTIRYIRSQKAISFGVFQIDKQLTLDIDTCTKLYGN